MGANVFANGKEISSKASGNKTIAAMPDVCLSPPSPPAGPIPIPYPNFSQASDTTGGSKKVKIGGKEVGLKGKSSYKKSKGDEAATRNFGASVVSHVIQGAIKHQAGSFNVKIEGSNVVRFGDLTTGNHNNPGLPPTPDQASAAAAKIPKSECKELSAANKAKRKETGQDNAKTTITHASVKGEKSWSCSKDLATKYRNGSYKGGLERYYTKRKTEAGAKISDVKDAKGRKGKKASNMCDEARKKFQYGTSKSTSRPHTSHTESRLIEDLFAKGTPKAGTVVVLSINWKYEDDSGKMKTSDNPCNRCRKLLCAAQECGIIVAICNNKNKAKSLEEKTGKQC